MPSMLLAVRPRLAAFGVEVRYRRAGIVQAPPARDIHHAVLCVFPAVRRLLFPFETKRRSHLAVPLAERSHFRHR